MAKLYAKNVFLDKVRQGKLLMRHFKAKNYVDGGTKNR